MSYSEGFVDLLDGPGLGIEIYEEYVHERDRQDLD